jgi:hypothetical protein
MGLWSGGDLITVVGSCGDGAVLRAPLGGGGGHTSGLVMGDPQLVSHAPDLGARVPVGPPLDRLRFSSFVLLSASVGSQASR